MTDSILPKDYCAFHHAIEPHIEGAPYCFECWHQFDSDQDLVDQHNALARELDLTIVTSADEVFSCPLCCHDL